MGKVDDALKGWKPEFGNSQHISMLTDLKTFRFLEARPKHTKATLEKMNRIANQIVWVVEEDKKRRPQ